MSYYAYEIRQEPGPSARRSAGPHGVAHAKRLGTGEAPSAREALTGFIANRYPRGHKQYVEHRLEWSGVSAYSDRWHRDDGMDSPGRRWRAIVTLANGRYLHDIVLLAWRES